MHPKVGLLSTKIMPKHFLNNSKTTLKKSRKRLFRPPKWPKMTPQTAKMSLFLTEYFDFRGHLSTFRAEKTPKSRPFKVENNAQTLPKQLQNNFEKVEKTTFSTPKMAKSRMSTWQKVSIFGSIFDLRALFLACWYFFSKKKSFPLIAKDI